MPENENETIYRIDARVDEIGERVSKIEGRLDNKAPKGFMKTLSEYGGLVALVFSIIIGGFTLYDKSVLQPRKDALQKEANFRDDIKELSNIVAQISKLDWSNPAVAHFQLSTWTPQRLALLEKIKKSEKGMPGVLKFADRMLLANEYEALNFINEALDQAELANQSATDQVQVANASWIKGRLNGKLNKLADMRKFFSFSVDEFKSSGLNNNSYSVMQLYIQWISLELINGTCETAKEVYSKMAIDINRKEVWPKVKKQINKEFADMILESPRDCNLEQFK
ncbi:MAG: hypothetical protein ACYDAI_13980 [Trichloromonadaceae bacterium]